MLGPPHMAEQNQDDQLEPTYSSSVKLRDVTLRTSQKRWMIGRSGERGSGISMLAARHDGDDDTYIKSKHIYIVIHRQTVSLHHSSSVWLDMRDAWSWDRNLDDFMPAGYSTSQPRQTQRKWRNFHAYVSLLLCLHIYA